MHGLPLVKGEYSSETWSDRLEDYSSRTKKNIETSLIKTVFKLIGPWFTYVTWELIKLLNKEPQL